MVAYKQNISPNDEFGNLVVQCRVSWHTAHTRWRCRCKCGNIVEVFGSHLRSGKTDCGCVYKQRLIARNTKHGHKSRRYRSPEYTSWVAMLQRCENPKHRHYRIYGGRGITVCDSWHTFTNSLADMGQRPSQHHSLGRRHNDDNYGPETCFWATIEEQVSDRSTSRLVEIAGVTRTVAQWCRIYGIKHGTVRARERRGRDIVGAITMPVDETKTKVVTRSTETGEFIDQTEARSRRSKRSKANVSKGKSHERRVASLLTDWAGIEFRRRRVEGRDNATLWVDSAADVIPVEADFAFSVEAKSGAGFSIDALLADPVKCLFCTWWFQTCYDAQLISGIRGRLILPMLFFKPHPNHDWVAFSTRSIDIIKPRDSGKLRGPGVLWFPHLLVDEYRWVGEISGDVSHSKKHPNMVRMAMESLYICRWKDFAANVDPSSVLTPRPVPAGPSP